MTRITCKRNGLNKVGIAEGLSCKKVCQESMRNCGCASCMLQFAFDRLAEYEDICYAGDGTEVVTPEMIRRVRAAVENEALGGASAP